MPTKRLPISADISHLKHQAKDLLLDFRNGKMSAYQRIREFHPKFIDLSDVLISEQTFSLSDAQLSIAREYGYSSWPRLKTVVSEAEDLGVLLIHNDRIEDDKFQHALDFLDEGNESLLRTYLMDHPDIVHQQIFFEGDNYFTEPTLIEFVAENPIRQGRLPDNIVETARIILEAGAKGNQKSIDNTVGLIASGRVARECGVQAQLLQLLCDYGADPNAGMQSALAHGEFEAAELLIVRGAYVDLPSAAALNLKEQVGELIGSASEEQLQLGLALSATHGREIIAAMLLEAGANPNLYNPPGGHSHCTPLHSAAIEGHLETVKLLIEGGARLDIGDIHRDATALAWAEYAGHKDVISYIKSKL
jgi:hypothetical protein